MAPKSPEELQEEAGHVVFLFELALRRARQLYAEGYHPEDLYIGATSALHAYETTTK